MKDLSIQRIINGKYTEATLIKGTKWIYYSLPKCANTSIRQAINLHNGVKSKTFKEIHDINKFRLREKSLRRLTKKGYIIFVFKRDEEKRLNSAYNDFILHKGDRVKTYDIGIGKVINFEDFKKKVLAIPEEEREYHLKSQEFLLKDIKYDWYGDVDNIKEEWANLNNYLGLKLELKHLHKTSDSGDSK